MIPLENDTFRAIAKQTQRELQTLFNIALNKVDFIGAISFS